MRIIWILMVAALAGCSAIKPAPVTAAFAEPACAAVARQRQSDAAVNGVDGEMLNRIAHDSYAVCLEQNRLDGVSRH